MQEISTEISESMSFCNPEKGARLVRFSTDKLFIYQNNEKTKSITYFGNFENQIGLLLNATYELKNSQYRFVIRESLDGTILGESEILEVINSQGLQLISIVKNEFKIITIGTWGSTAKCLALSIDLDPALQKAIDNIECKNFPYISRAYENLKYNRTAFHIGFINLRVPIPQPYYSLIKRAFKKILSSHRKIIENVSNWSYDYKIIAHTKTILIIPSDEISKQFKIVNKELRIFLDDFNKYFGKNYKPDEYTDVDYQPHITLINGNVVDSLNIEPDLFSKTINAVFHDNKINIHLLNRIPDYNIPVIESRSEIYVRLEKARNRLNSTQAVASDAKPTIVNKK